MEVRPYAESDHGGVVAVILPIQQQEFQVPITLEMQPDLQNIPEFYQTRRGGFWVAMVGDEVVGTIALVDIGNGLGALRKMFVRKDHRGRDGGAAQRLLETLLDHCRTQGISVVYLGTTAAFLAAHRFYEKNGFAEIAKTDLPASFPVMSVDTKFYRRVLG